MSHVGVRFRLHGRDPETGLDCLGLVAAALRDSGRTPVMPANYTLRHRDVARLLPFAGANGFRPAEGVVQAGDLLLLRPGSTQYHLAIACGSTRVVHAHAALGRIVVSPLGSETPALHWRLAAQMTD